jgi:hypothetical protein
VLKSRWTSLGVALSRSSQIRCAKRESCDSLIEGESPFARSRVKRTSLIEISVVCLVVLSFAAYFSFALAMDGLVFVLIVLLYLVFVRMMKPKAGEQVNF